MFKQRQVLYSPFSVNSVSQAESGPLLLQLIIYELIQAQEHTQDRLVAVPLLDSAPFDWSRKPGSKNKVAEHASLLQIAFPELADQTQLFLQRLDEPCQKLLTYLEPFIFTCKESENLLLFLIRHQKSLSIKSILDRIHPQGLAKLKATVAARYRKRGFCIARWTV